MKNLVMGTGKGYSWYVLEPFVRSFLKNCSENTDLVLFVEGVSDFTLNQLKSFGERIKIEPFPEYAKTGRPNNLRWKIFRDYCRIHGAEYSQILTSDTRDVIFQDDVFKFFEMYPAYWAYATEYDNIKGERTGTNLNYKWLTESLGKAEADKLADKDIICDGTVIGTSKEMLFFFEKMVENIPSFDTGHDQIIQQYLYYHNLLPFENIIKMDNISGVIFTPGLFYILNREVVKDNKILRGDGGVPAVVHQYDRKKSLIQFVNILYRKKDFKFNSNFTDIDSIFDQMYHLIHAENWKDLLKVFVNYFMDNADTFYNKTEYSVSFAGDPSRKFSEYLFQIYQTLLNTNNPSKPEIEILQLFLQHAMIQAFSKEMNINHLSQIYSLTMYSIKNNINVTPALKNFLYKRLLDLANLFVENGDLKNAEMCLKNLVETELPLKEDFYLMQAKIYRKMKRKEDALKAYQKLLEME